MITIKRKRVYNAKLVTDEGKPILAISAIVVRKEQAKGILGIGDVDETLFCEDYDIVIAKDVLEALLEKEKEKEKKD